MYKESHLLVLRELSRRLSSIACSTGLVALIGVFGAISANAQITLSGQLSGGSYSAGLYSATLTLTNTGAAPANDVMLSSLTGKPTGTSVVEVLANPALPVSLGSLAPGASAAVNFSLTSCWAEPMRAISQ